MLFASYNIQYSLGKDGHYDLERIVGEIGTADIIALQEVDRHWERTDFLNQPARIGELLPDFYWIYGPPVDVDASSLSVTGKIHNRRRQFGDMLLSRWPILSARLHLLPRHGTIDKFNPQYGALEGVIDCPGGPLRVISLHLGYLSAAERLDQLAFLLAKLRAAPSEGGAWSGHEADKADHWSLGEGPPAMPEAAVLMGDFNFQPGTLEYDMVAGAPDAIYGRLKVNHHYVDSWVAAGHGEDEGVTCFGDPDNPRRPSMRLDYGFVSSSLADKVKRSWIDLEAQGSDHQPYWFELDMEGEGDSLR